MNKINSLPPWQDHSSGSRQTILQINKGARINKDHQGVKGVFKEIKRDGEWRSGERRYLEAGSRKGPREGEFLSS